MTAQQAYALRAALRLPPRLCYQGEKRGAGPEFFTTVLPRKAQ
jgi:hypothetical protein